MFEEKIRPLFLRLLATQSDTNTLRETYIEEQILNWIKEQPYFQENSDLCGTHPIENDPYERNVVWSLVKGKGNKTIVMIHHHDTLDIEEYGKLKSVALRPDELEAALRERQLSPQVGKDLESGEWTFGRGTADMKSGAAIQLVLSSYFSEDKNFNGNILLLSVPDEETLSKGMLSAISLMTALRSRYQLEYILTINSEPYFNQTKGKAIFYEGSVGKIMPVLYVKGVKSHIGEPFNGFNPSLVLADLQRKTELNVQLCDVYGNEATPPPVWVNLKDRKKAYDASIPEAATGYFNWLTFTRSPKEIMDKLVSLSNRTLRDTLIHFQDAYENYCNLIGEEPDEISFTPKVYTFEMVYNMAMEKNKSLFEEAYNDYQVEMVGLLHENKIALPEAATRLIEFITEWIDLEGPTIIVALSGPYYPHINNQFIDQKIPFSLEETINRIAGEKYNLTFESQGFFMGISDLSYASWVGKKEDIELIKANSPGWDVIYRIPLKDLSTLKMPVINIGPWGKDLHKVTERVLTMDVYEIMPNIIKDLILECLLKSDQEQKHFMR
ncbi:M20/M25/M40 family metallo-hydrolase [Alkaliphilus peptidifermentans]|uniref:Arginine utilization protein RocB n=1 Tax=Alkaliphilus peptidifermentans DSM 18978 TaxID=1120976 RepID=A0A1G5JT45_9FIRM|nr:M20/M25/M40 family metallo-hydrolase [Alkaliphilus peptidifermentans]SCY91516.1 Arginine utilization protein RocB [Alkaliphilus peptidifermentans DSM 18978]